MRLLSILLALAALCAYAPATAAGPAAAMEDEVLGRALDEEQLARETGKFILPNGASLALSITSDTRIDGVAVLRTVLTVDETASLQVFARDGNAPVGATRAAGAPIASAVPMGVSILFDRQSGTRTVTPTFVAGASAVRIGPAATSASAGLEPVALVVGGPALRTPDGLVMLDRTVGGAQVSLAGDRFGVAHLVGRSVATAITNSANDRTFDSVTNIDIDLRDVSGYVAGTAALRVDDMALDATRGMVR